MADNPGRRDDNLLEQIQNRLESLNKSERKVAEAKRKAHAMRKKLREEKRKAGLLLTKAQKEAQKRAAEFAAQALAAGAVPAALEGDEEDEEDKKPKRVVYGKKKKSKQEREEEAARKKAAEEEAARKEAEEAAARAAAMDDLLSEPARLLNMVEILWLFCASSAARLRSFMRAFLASLLAAESSSAPPWYAAPTFLPNLDVLLARLIIRSPTPLVTWSMSSPMAAYRFSAVPQSSSSSLA